MENCCKVLNTFGNTTFHERSSEGPRFMEHRDLLVVVVAIVVLQVLVVVVVVLLLILLALLTT